MKDGIVDGIVKLAIDRFFFVTTTLQNMLHVRLVYPLVNGVIGPTRFSSRFLEATRSLADPTGRAEIRAVVGIPANATEQAREDIRRCAYGIFDPILLIPKPFLLCMGYRDYSASVNRTLHRSRG